MSVVLEMVSTPKKGSLIVRFLGNPRSLLTHQVKGKPRVCPGELTCKNHEYGTWKGYAPSQFWDVTRKVWIPCVFEITQCAAEVIGTTGLRGTCYVFKRVPRRWGSNQVGVEKLTEYSADNLAGAFDVEAVVERVFKTREIAWDVPLDDYVRPTAEISNDPPPPLPTAPPTPPALSEREHHAAVNKLKQRLATGTAPESANGSAGR